MEVCSFLIVEENKFLLVIFNLKLLNFMHRWWCHNYYVFVYKIRLINFVNSIFQGADYRSGNTSHTSFAIPGSTLVLTHENSNAWLSRMNPELKFGIQSHHMTWNSSIWILMIEVSTWHFSDLESIQREKSQISSTSSPVKTGTTSFSVSVCECSQVLHILWKLIWIFFNDRKKRRFVFLCLIFKPKFWHFKIHIDFYIGKILIIKIPWVFLYRFNFL